MQKNEFEKQVQQKMEELKIPPSGSVWQNIEPRITRRKRRKRSLILLLFLLTGLLCGGYFFWHTSKNLVSKYPQTSSQKPLVNKYNTPKENLTKSITENNTHGNSSLNKKSSAKVVKDKQAQKILASLIKKRYYKTITISSPGSKQLSLTETSLKKLKKDNPIDVENNSKQASVDPEENKDFAVKDTELTKQAYAPVPAKTDQVIDTLKHHDSALISLNVIRNDTDGLQKKQSDENKKSRKLPLTAIKKTWSWGLTLSAGISGIPNGFLGSLDKSYSYADAIFASAQGNSQGNLVLLPSKIKSSGALVAGFFLERNISAKKIFAIGLNYKKLSSTNLVGARNDTTGNYSLINPINTYHNNYHFLELPVSLQIQITSKIIPLFWDVGISFSQLISSNALQFNSAAEVYRKDNSLFNKTQAGFNMGLSASLFSMQKTAVLIGPYFYYGTSKIAAEGLYNNLHFTFIGVRSRILFKK